MALMQLDLNSIKDLDDGRVMLTFAHELKRAVMDCLDRPGDKKPRSVCLEFKLTPVVGEDGQCEGAEGEFDIKSKVPTRKSKTYSFAVRKGGQLVFSSESPENVDQTTIDEMDRDGKVNRKRLD